MHAKRITQKTKDIIESFAEYLLTALFILISPDQPRCDCASRLSVCDIDIDFFLFRYTRLFCAATGKGQLFHHQPQFRFLSFFLHLLYPLAHPAPPLDTRLEASKWLQSSTTSGYVPLLPPSLLSCISPALIQTTTLPEPHGRGRRNNRTTINNLHIPSSDKAKTEIHVHNPPPSNQNSQSTTANNGPIHTHTHTIRLLTVHTFRKQ